MSRLSAERQRRSNPGSIHDAAGSDDRQFELLDQQARQRKRAQPIIVRMQVERTAMSAGLDALRNDRIDIRRCNLLSILQICRAGQELDAGFP